MSQLSKGQRLTGRRAKPAPSLVARAFALHKLRPRYALGDQPRYSYVWSTLGCDTVGGHVLPGDWFGLLPGPLDAPEEGQAIAAAVDAFELLPPIRRRQLAGDTE
jgi:hypothetical protein